MAFSELSFVVQITCFLSHLLLLKGVKSSMATTLDFFFFFFFLLNFEVSFAHIHFVSKIPLKHSFVNVIYFMLAPR